jgi:preprotein translocase subunit SecD
MRALLAAMGCTLEGKSPSAMLGRQYRWRSDGPGPKRARRKRVRGVLSVIKSKGFYLAAAALVVISGCGHGRKSETFVVRLKAVPAPGHLVTTQDLDRSASIMRKRLQELGVPDGKVRIESRDVIAIQLPKGAATNIRFASKTALLEFYDFEAVLAGRSVAPGLSRLPIAKPSRTALVGKDRSTPPRTVVVSCKVADGNCLSVQQVPTSKGFYLFKNEPALTGADLDLSGTRADIDPQTNTPVVLIQFTNKGKKIFHDITRREAQRGALACQGARSQQDVLRCAQHFAIVLDHEIVSLPYIDFARNPDGIPGDNGAQIVLGHAGSLGEAKKLAQAVQTGALPVQFVRLP